MTPFTPFTARTTLLAVDDIDTDQIIPARFLTGTAKVGLGAHLFADWRVPLDGQILVAGANFGCGSSREHAVWALVDRGFRAVIARSFGDIFRANATKNGLLPIALPECAWERCARAGLELRVDLEAVTLADGTALPYPLDPFAKHCLATGLDELGYILSFLDRITAYEQRRD